jgi:phosphatidylglycerophosphate synthase
MATPTAVLAATPHAALDLNIATPATGIANIATVSGEFDHFSDFVMNNLWLVFLVVYPLLGVLLALPTILIETFLIYFIGRFEKRGLSVWVAVALTVHTTFIIQVLNRIIMLIHPTPIPDILYILHWIFIILVVRKFYPMPKNQALISKTPPQKKTPGKKPKK